MLYYVTNDLAIDKNTYTRLDLGDDDVSLCVGRKTDDADTIIIFFETNSDPIYTGWASVDTGDVEITYDNWDNDFASIRQDDVIDEIKTLLDGIKIYDNMANHFPIYANCYNDVVGEHKVYFKTDEAYPDPSIDNANREDEYITYKAGAITETGRKCYVYWDFVAYDDDGNEIDSDCFDYQNTDCIIKYY